jgi:hypothetical protein
MKVFTKLTRIGIVILVALTATRSYAQLKVGTNPTQIQKSSILELESDKQGFLLPRLTDTTAINSLNPPDGMLIYLTPSTTDARGLYMRKNGKWQRIVTDSAALNKWSKDGDMLAGTEKLGSLNAQSLKIITNNLDRLVIDGTTGDLTVSENATFQKNATVGNTLTVVDSTTSGKLFVNDTVQFRNLNKSTDLTEILVIDTTVAGGGTVRRRTIATDAFKNWFVGAFKNTANANGLSKIVGALSDSLVLHAATATTPGGVSIETQTFGGNKTFQDSLTAAATALVGTTGTANSTLQVSGSLSLSIRTVTGNTSLGATDYTVLVDATSAAITVTLPSPNASISGRTYIIKKIGGGLTNDVTISGAIEDGTSMSIYNDWTVVKVQTDGSKWYVIK